MSGPHRPAASRRDRSGFRRVDAAASFLPLVIPNPTVPPRTRGARPHIRLRGSRRLLLLIGVAALASACVPSVPRSSSVLPSPRTAAPWLVEPGDVIRLKNWGAPEQSGDLLVNDRGVVLVPTVGRLSVIGAAPDSVERQIIRGYAGRIDASRVEVTILRPIAVVGGVKAPSVQLADPTTSVLSLMARSGGATTPGGDTRVYVLRAGETAREVSLADRAADLGLRATDELYVQDPPFVVRNDLTIRAAFELLQFTATLITLIYLVKRG